MPRGLRFTIQLIGVLLLGYGQLHSTPIALIGIYILAWLAVLGSYVEYRGYRKRHAENHALAANDDIPYFFVLRSFGSTALYRRHYARRQHDIMPDGTRTKVVPDTDWFLPWLALSCRVESSVLVVLGSVTDDLFGGHDLLILQPRIESNWMQMFQLVASRSRAIIVVPEASPGILSEMNHLRASGLLERVLFFMLPQRNRPWLNFIEQRDARWEEVRALLLPKGFHLPEYRREGAIFTLDSAGDLRNSVSLRTSRDELAPYVERADEVLQHMPPQHLPSIDDMVPYLKKAEPLLRDIDVPWSSVSDVYQQLRSSIIPPEEITWFRILLRRANLPGYILPPFSGCMLIAWILMLVLMTLTWPWW